MGITGVLVCAAIFGLLLVYFRPLNVVRLWRKRWRMIGLVEKIPGPPSLPIIGCAYTFKWKIEEFSAQMFEFSKVFQEQGFPIMRIWVGPFPVICAFSPESVKAVLESNVVITKGKEYDIVKRWLGTGLLTSTGEKWKSRRKMITPAFHFNVLNSFLEIHDKEARIFVDQLNKYTKSEETFDIYGYIKRCALDIICETSMGTKVDAQTNHNHYYVNAVQRMNELSFLYTRMPWLWIKPIWYACGYGYEYDRNLALVTNFTREVIADRQKTFHHSSTPFSANGSASATTQGNGNSATTIKKKSAFLDLLLSTQDEGRLTDEDIREEVDTFMFEGHDTTSSGMAWSLWCLAHHSECQEKVIEEVDNIFGTSTRSITNDDLKELVYLEKCIKEAMRLFPPVPLFTRLVDEGDFDCAGYKIPPGCTLLVSPLVMHRNENVYENSFDYDPENFSVENSSKRHPYAYIPFSAGPRNCIGQKFALMEEKTVLSWFFRNYRYPLESLSCNGIKPKMEFYETFPCPEIILKPSKGIPVQITRR